MTTPKRRAAKAAAPEVATAAKADVAKKKRVRRKKKAASRKVGRPTDYRPEYAEQVAKLCALGATDMEIADFFKVSQKTIYRWQASHPEFSQSVVIGKGAPDDRVVRSLYHRAVGYSFESEKILQHQGKVIRVKTREHVPPDTGAAFNWLKNRRGAEWRDKQELEVTGSFSELTDEQIDQRLQQLLTKAADAGASG